MGVLTMEMEKINKNINDMQQRQEQIRKITQKKEQEQNKKQYEKDLLIACEEDLKSSMDRVFQKVLEENGYNQITLDVILMQYYNVDTRNAYISEFGKTTEERNRLEKIYDKRLKETYNKWKNHIKYCQIKNFSKEQNKQSKLDKIININNSVLKILKWALIIIFIPIFILFKFLYDCSKDK